jgi:type I restriction enzyme M protein
MDNKKEQERTELQTYIDRTDKEHISKLVPNSQVEKSDYNLSVSIYVEQKDTREVVNITELNKEIARIVSNQERLRKEIDTIVADLEGAGC